MYPDGRARREQHEGFWAYRWSFTPRPSQTYKGAGRSQKSRWAPKALDGEAHRCSECCKRPYRVLQTCVACTVVHLDLCAFRLAPYRTGRVLLGRSFVLGSTFLAQQSCIPWALLNTAFRLRTIELYRLYPFRALELHGGNPTGSCTRNWERALVHRISFWQNWEELCCFRSNVQRQNT